MTCVPNLHQDIELSNAGESDNSAGVTHHIQRDADAQQEAEPLAQSTAYLRADQNLTPEAVQARSNGPPPLMQWLICWPVCLPPGCPVLDGSRPMDAILPAHSLPLSE